MRILHMVREDCEATIHKTYVLRIVGIPYMVGGLEGDTVGLILHKTRRKLSIYTDYADGSEWVLCIYACRIDIKKCSERSGSERMIG